MVWVGRAGGVAGGLMGLLLLWRAMPDVAAIRFLVVTAGIAALILAFALLRQED